MFYLMIPLSVPHMGGCYLMNSNGEKVGFPTIHHLLKYANKSFEEFEIIEDWNNKVQSRGLVKDYNNE